MKKKQILISLWIALGYFVDAAEVITHKGALELARQEKILVSRLLKDIVLIGSNFRHTRAIQKDEKEIIDLYASNLKKLKAADSSYNWHAMMREIEQHGKDNKTFTDRQPNRQKGMQYLRVFSTMDHLWDAPIAYLAEKTGSRPDNPAGVLPLYRIYAYQIPALYLLRTWGLEDPSRIDRAMEHIRLQVHKSFWILEASHKTTNATRKLLKKLQGILLYFDVMWDSDTYTPTLVMKKSKEAQAIIEKLIQTYTD